MKNPVIIIIEDQDEIIEPLKDRLKATFPEHLIVSANSAQMGIFKFDRFAEDMFAAENPDVSTTEVKGIILDMGMPVNHSASGKIGSYNEFAGLEVYRHVRKFYPNMPIVINSSTDSQKIQNLLIDIDGCPSKTTSFSGKNIKNAVEFLKELMSV
jgi:CheY-like chemotaxis protein